MPDPIAHQVVRRQPASRRSASHVQTAAASSTVSHASTLRCPRRVRLLRSRHRLATRPPHRSQVASRHLVPGVQPAGHRPPPVLPTRAVCCQASRSRRCMLTPRVVCSPRCTLSEEQYASIIFCEHDPRPSAFAVLPTPRGDRYAHSLRRHLPPRRRIRRIRRSARSVFDAPYYHVIANPTPAPEAHHPLYRTGYLHPAPARRRPLQS